MHGTFNYGWAATVTHSSGTASFHGTFYFNCSQQQSNLEASARRHALAKAEEASLRNASVTKVTIADLPDIRVR